MTPTDIEKLTSLAGRLALQSNYSVTLSAHDTPVRCEEAASAILSLIAALEAAQGERDEALERVNTLGSLADDLQARIRDLGNERNAAEAALKEAREGLARIVALQPDLIPEDPRYFVEAAQSIARALLSKQDSGKESQ